jgi:hypothetical protein
MQNKFEIEWRMTCHVNGVSFEFNGTGEGRPDTGVTELHLESTGFPEGFDPVSCPCICNAPATIASARPLAGGNPVLLAAGNCLEVSPARIGAIYDARGEQLLNLSVSSSLTFDGRRLLAQSVMRGWSRLPALERNITPSDEHITAEGPGRAISTLRFRLLAKSGEMLSGLTLVPYCWKAPTSIPFPLTRVYEAINVEWNGDRKVHTTVRSRLMEALQPATRSSGSSTTGPVDAISARP